jgi:hypothetical protein
MLAKVRSLSGDVPRFKGVYSVSFREDPRFPGRGHPSGEKRVINSKQRATLKKSEQERSSSPLEFRLLDVEIYAAIGSLVSCAIDGLKYQPVAAGGQILHVHFEPHRNDRISFLDVFIGSHHAGE